MGILEVIDLAVKKISSYSSWFIFIGTVVIVISLSKFPAESARVTGLIGCVLVIIGLVGMLRLQLYVLNKK